MIFRSGKWLLLIGVFIVLQYFHNYLHLAKNAIDKSSKLDSVVDADAPRKNEFEIIIPDDDRVELEYTRRSGLVNPFPFEPVLAPSDPCADPELYIFLYVYTAPNNYEDRMLLRTTWLDLSLYPDTKIGYIFLMGLEKDSSGPSEALRKENAVYNDIYVENYIDSYRNLTRKGISGLRYVMRHCMHVRRIVRSDDDALIDMFHLIQFFRSEDEGFSKNVFLCRFQPSEPIRDVESKWYVSWDEWPEKDYPPVCNGFIYIMSPDVCAVLFNASLSTRYFYFEDVYITGSLVQKTHIPRVNIPRFYDGKFWRFNATLHATPEDEMFPVLFTLTHKNTAEEVRDVWNFIKARHRRRTLEN